MSGEEILAVGARLNRAMKRFQSAPLQEEMKNLNKVANAIGRSWSGSNLGYHACVYYKNFDPPPSGAHFNPQYGLRPSYSSDGTRGEWVEYEHSAVVDLIRQEAGGPDLDRSNKEADDLKEICEQSISEMQSVIHIILDSREDPYLRKMLEKLENINFPSPSDYARSELEKKRFVSTDMLAINQGARLAPHQQIIAQIKYTLIPEMICSDLANMAKQIGSHILRIEKQNKKQSTVGTNVFIGHGRSAAWRDLKDFVKDRLRLPYDEFNRVPVAGFTNIARLSEMLDAAAIALVVLTAEDETVDGAIQARMNVIHEVGLFQGRLGFSRAIVLLEEGCAEFSNIQGLGQIRFPKGNISAKFEEIRQVLEREGLVEE